MACCNTYRVFCLVLVNTSSSLAKLGGPLPGLVRKVLSSKSSNSATSQLRTGLVIVGILCIDAEVFSISDVDDLASNHGQENLLTAELLHRDLHKVLVENDDISKFPSLKRTNMLVRSEEVSAVDGDGT